MDVLCSDDAERLNNTQLLQNALLQGESFHDNIGERFVQLELSELTTGLRCYVV